MKWKPIETAPKDGTEFMALIDGLPYVSRISKGRFEWLTHGDVGEGDGYWIHIKDGKQLLEKFKDAEYDYQKVWYVWRLGFDFKPSHWMPKLEDPEDEETCIK